MIPKVAYLGQTLEFRRKFYDAAGGLLSPSEYTATLYLRSATGRANITGAADGEFFKFQATLAADDGTLSGQTSYFVVLDDGSSAEIHAAQGTIDVKADPTGNSLVDFRSHAQIMVDKIESVLEGTADHETLSYTISTSAGSRSLSKVPRGELRDLLREYRAELRAEQRRARGRSGKNAGRVVKSRVSRRG